MKKEIKKRKVRQFQIRRENSDFKICDDLCFKSKNMFNYTLFALRQLNFASFPEKNKEGVLHQPEFYIDKIDEELRKYITSKDISLKNKETGEKLKRTVYNLEQFDLNTFCAKANQADYRNLQVSASLCISA